MKRYWVRIMGSAVVWNYLAAMLRVGAAVLLLPLLVRKLPPEHLGIWYVFAALGGMATLLDMGFGQSVTRSAGYLWAGAERLLAFGVTAPNRVGPPAREPNFRLLTELVETMKVFYRVLGVGVFALLLIAGGWWIRLRTHGVSGAESLQAAWWLYAFGVFVNTVGGLWPALLAGVNGVRQSQQIFFFSLFLYYLVAVGGLLAGWGIWALVVGQVLMGIVVRVAGRRCFLKLAGPRLREGARKWSWSLVATLWPNSWRTGLNTMGVFVTLSANTLVCSAFLDLTTTASYGLSLQVVMLLVQLSSAWLQVKLPVINQLRTKGDQEGILRLLVPRVRLYAAIYCAGGAVLALAGDYVLNDIIGARTALLRAPQFATMLVVVGLEGAHALFRDVVITGNENPFVKPILISAAGVFAFSVALTPLWGVWGMLLAQGVVQASFNNWWIVLKGIRSLGISAKEFWLRFV